MKDTAPKWQGVAAVAALFGVIAAGIALVIYDYQFPGAFLIGLLVALIVAILLWLGWRDANPAPMGARDLSADASTPRVSTGAVTGGVAAAGAAGAAVATGALSGSASGDAAAARAKADADAAAAKAKADAAKAKADADAKAAKAKASAAAKAKADATAKAKTDADAAAAKAKADAAAAKKKAEAAAKKKADAAAKKKADAAAAAAAKSGDVDYDGDGVIEGKNEGKRPAALKGPRGGKADDLKQIKGVGPKMEKTCNSLGFYHFDQIAAWSKDEIAWVDANLEGFRGRVTRDTWVAQAKILAAGGTTEFSKKVDKGGVY